MLSCQTCPRVHRMLRHSQGGPGTSKNSPDFVSDFGEPARLAKILPKLPKLGNRCPSLGKLPQLGNVAQACPCRQFLHLYYSSTLHESDHNPFTSGVY